MTCSNCHSSRFFCNGHTQAGLASTAGLPSWPKTQHGFMASYSPCRYSRNRMSQNGLGSLNGKTLACSIMALPLVSEPKCFIHAAESLTGQELSCTNLMTWTIAKLPASLGPDWPVQNWAHEWPAGSCRLATLASASIPMATALACMLVGGLVDGRLARLDGWQGGWLAGTLARMESWLMCVVNAKQSNVQTCSLQP